MCGAGAGILLEWEHNVAEVPRQAVIVCEEMVRKISQPDALQHAEERSVGSAHSFYHHLQ